MLASVLLSAMPTCFAGGAIGPATSVGGPWILFYIGVPLGPGGGGHVFGLRIERPLRVPGPQASFPLVLNQNRELIDLQFRPHSDVRIEFDRRVTWNLGRQEFGLNNSRPGIVLHLPLHPFRIADAARP